jgi:uncharacterized protein with ParB-like and HNH nuclease domain
MERETTIGDLFYEKGIKFAIPAYQRAYSWECDADRRQVEQFITDIKEQNPKKEYFLGHFLFEKDKHDNKKYWVIDGQQRLTTVVIFFSCLIGELEKREKTEEKLIDTDGETVEIWRIRENYIKMGTKYKFSTVHYDNPFFESTVFENNNNSNVIDSASKRRILKAKKRFDKLFEEADTTEILSWKFILENAIITTFEVTDKVQATQIFAFQNDRGKDLTTLEKLKAFLMHKIYSVSEDADPEDVIKNIESEFSDIYRQSERIENFDEDRVLGFHNVAYLSGGDNSLSNVKRALSSLTNNYEKEQWIKEFVHTLKETFFVMEIIEQKYEYNNSIADILILDAQNTIPLLIKLYHFHKNEEKLILGIAKIVEHILFKLIYTVADYRTNIFPSIAKSYQGDFTKLENELHSYAEKGFQWWWNFNGDCKNYFVNNNRHDTSKIKYVLWKYENNLREKKRSRLISPNDYINKYNSKRLENTIDHITPQNPDFREYTDDFKQDYLHNIGNLALMTWSDNSRKNNNNPVEMINLFDKDYLSHEEIKRVLETKGIWAEYEIKARRDNILKFIYGEWNL